MAQTRRAFLQTAAMAIGAVGAPLTLGVPRQVPFSQ